MDLRADRLENRRHRPGARPWNRVCGRRKLLDLAEAGVTIERHQVVRSGLDAEVRLMFRNVETLFAEISLEHLVSGCALPHDTPSLVRAWTRPATPRLKPRRKPAERVCRASRRGLLANFCDYVANPLAVRQCSGQLAASGSFGSVRGCFQL